MATEVRDGASAFLGTDRFIVERELGSGAMGVVYRVFDRTLDTHVALKLLRRVDPMGLLRFKREFRALADLTHRNLVTLYELVAYHDSWFFTMEVVDGANFLAYVRDGQAAVGTGPGTDSVDTVEGPGGAPDTQSLAAITRPDPPTEGTGVSALPSRRMSHSTLRTDRLANDEQYERLREGLRQLAAGVSALHNAGHLHRDIKPSNVLVKADARVVLLDFGVVTELTSQGEDEGMLIGTPAYMAPEQSLGAPLQPASDWYAVGVVLYEALSGHRPFEGDARTILTMKRALDPPSLRTHTDIPADLLAACEGLLARDVEARMTGAELLDVLASRPSLPRARTLAPFNTADDLFIGREHHVQVLSEGFDAVVADKPHSVFVSGRSGAGKSALCQYFLDHVRASGDALVLSGRCYEQESVPYKALDSLVDALSMHLVGMPTSEVRDIVPRSVKALARLFPVLNRVQAIKEASSHALETPDVHELRMRGFTALRRLLTRLADRGPLVLYVDDVQWADVESGELLAEVLRPPDPPVLLLIASFRTEARDTSAFLRAVRRAHAGDSDGSGGVVELSVDDLPRDQADLLARKRLERAGVSEGIDEWAAQIARESRGNPFFILELSRLATSAPLAGDVTLDGLMRSRLDELDDDARALLRIVALAGRPLPQAAARLAAEVEDADASALVRLRNAHLIRSATEATEDGSVEVYHDRIRASVVEHISPAERPALHARLALALEKYDGDAETLAAHFEAAGNARRAAHYCEVAGRLASEALAFDRAADLYARALALHPRDSAQLHTEHADALAGAGRGRAAAEAYLAAAQLSEGDHRLECERQAAEQLLRAGFIEQGVAALDKVLRHVGTGIPISSRRALASVVWGRIKLKLRGMQWRECERADIEPQNLRRLEVFQAVAKSLAVVDTVRGADFQSRGLLLALRLGDRSRVARALALEGGYLATQGAHAKARSTVNEGVKLARRCDDPHTRALASTADGIVRYLCCDYVAAVHRLSEGEQLFLDRTTGTAWEVNTTRLARLWALRQLGAQVEMRRSFRLYLRDAKRRGDRYVETTMRRLCNELWLVQDNPTGARDNLAAATWMPPDGVFHLQHWYELRAQAEVALYEGRGAEGLAEAEPRLAQLAGSLLVRVQMVRAESRWLHARLLLAAASESARPAPLRRRAAKLSRHIRREGILCAQVWSSLIDGALSAQAGDSARAASLLERAGAAAEDASMLLHAASAQHMRGQTLAGTDGKRLVASAVDWMQRGRIRNPAAMVRMVAPWLTAK